MPSADTVHIVVFLVILHFQVIRLIQEYLDIAGFPGIQAILESVVTQHSVDTHHILVFLATLHSRDTQHIVE